MTRVRQCMVGLIVSCVFALATPAQAQTTTRFYILPTFAQSGQNGSTFLSPKYLVASGLRPYTAVYYGVEPIAFVGLTATAAQHSALAANPDVILLPVDLSATLGAGAVTAVQTQLEAWRIPGTWVSTSTTWKQVATAVVRIFRLVQRFRGRTARSLFADVGSDLSTTVSQLSVAQRQALIAAAADLGIDTAGFTGASTLRQVLIAAAQAMGPVVINGTSF